MIRPDPRCPRLSRASQQPWPRRSRSRDVVDVLQPDRQPHIARGDAGGHLLGFGQLGVGGAGRMDRQAARVADVGDVVEQLQRIDESAAGIGAAGQLEPDQAALAVRQVFRRAFRADALVVAPDG